MPLADEIRALRDHVVADLNAVHDYYADTKVAWRIVRRAVSAGARFAVQNKVTGTVTTHESLAVKVSGYVVEQLAEATFQQIVSIFEDFFCQLLRLWLVAYPQGLAGRKVDFREVLDAPDKNAVILLVVDKEVNDVLYDRPAGWFAYLEKTVHLGCPTAEEIEHIAEAKASRDVLAHNRGIVNKIYLSKAGKLARGREGQRIQIPQNYHRETWELVRKVVTDISNAAIAKAGSVP